MRSVLFALLGWVAVTSAAPSVVYPLQDQTPPVGRVGSPFVFGLLPGSFTSDSNITYTAEGLPKWLQFSSNQATFYGTPSAADVGTTTVTVSARDSTGVANSSLALVVSKDPAPVVQLGFPAQIADPKVRQFASVETLPRGTGISVPPSWSFSLGWSGNTFKGSKRLYYSAHVAGTTSLPDWLKFSNTSFTFEGLAPAQPETHVVVVTATDIWGYTGAESSFVFSVGGGEPVEFGGNLTAINTTAYNNISYTIDTVAVNGTVAKVGDYSIKPDLTNLEWLSYDTKSNSITGTVPESWANGTVTPISIPVTLSSTNASNTLASKNFIELNIVPFFFTSNRLPDAASDNGTLFTYNIESYLRNKETNVNATVDPREAASWLMYYPENYTLVGTPPHNISYNSIDVAFFGVQNNITGKASMRVNITGGGLPPATGTPTPVPQGSVKHSHSHIKKIIIGVCVGVGGFLLLLALLLFCFCRRRTDKTSDEVVDEKMPTKDIKTPRNSLLPGFGAHRNRSHLGIDTLTNSPAKSATDSEMTSSTCAVTTPTTPTNKVTAEVKEGSPRRFGAIKGLFGSPNPESEEALQSQRDLDRQASFMGKPEPIAVRGAADQVPVPIIDVNPAMSSEESGNSLESWESPRSFHWSDEDHYLPPLMPLATGSNPADSSTLLADEPRAPPIAVVAAPREEATQLPGFYSRFQRNVGPGDMAHTASAEDVHTSYSEFSELNRGRSSYSLNDSFRDPGSALGTLSSNSGFGSGGQGTFNSSRHQPTHSESSGESNYSGSSFHAPSGLGRFTASSGLVSALSTDEPAVAQRQRVAQRSAVTPPVPMAPAETPEPPRPMSLLAGPVMPAGLQPVVHKRRASSSRRTTARIHATREHIVGPTAQAPPADEHLAYVGTTDDERDATITRR